MHLSEAFTSNGNSMELSTCFANVSLNSLYNHVLNLDMFALEASRSKFVYAILTLKTLL